MSRGPSPAGNNNDPPDYHGDADLVRITWKEEVPRSPSSDARPLPLVRSASWSAETFSFPHLFSSKEPS